MNHLTKETKDLIDRIARHQGSIFIKELLRKKRKVSRQIKIGVNKEDTISNLVSALDNQFISSKELIDWIREVEGWGKQHVYLFNYFPSDNNKLSKDKENEIVKILKSKNLDNLINSNPSLNFPNELNIDTISINQTLLSITWHQKYDNWQRDESKDIKDQKIDDDLYEFRAYRQDFIRSVVRLNCFLDKNLVAIFIQLPIGNLHTEALEKVKRFWSDFSGNELFKAVNISKAIKKIDQRDLDTANSRKSSQPLMESENTKFYAKGATVEFQADRTIGAWKNITAVRQVRKALRTKDFIGKSAKFRVKLNIEQDLKDREVKISMDGRKNKIYLFSQMTNSVVWSIIDDIFRNAN